jgi:hypothetical protein
MILSVNSDYLLQQHQPNDLCNEVGTELLNII